MRVCCQRCLGGVIVGGSSFFVCFLDQSATKLIIFFSFRNKKNPLAFHQSIIWHAIFKILQMEGFYGLLVRAGRRLFFLPYPPPCLTKEVEIFSFCILFLYFVFVFYFMHHRCTFVVGERSQSHVVSVSFCLQKFSSASAGSSPLPPCRRSARASTSAGRSRSAAGW